MWCRLETKGITPSSNSRIDITTWKALTDQFANVLAVEQRTKYIPLHHTCKDRRAEHDKGSRENEREKEGGQNNAILCQKLPVRNTEKRLASETEQEQNNKKTIMDKTNRFDKGGETTKILKTRGRRGGGNPRASGIYATMRPLPERAG